MTADFDVIVVGAGLAGSAASISLARKGVRVLLLEKARIPGERNVSGGILYGDFPGEWGLSGLVPGFESTAPLERQIISHEVVLLGTPDRAKGTVRYYRVTKTSLAGRLGIYPMTLDTGHDFTVLRSRFDRWMAGLAVDSGAVLSTGTAARALVIQGGAVTGVRTSNEDLNAKLVIDASGVASTLVDQAGLRERLSPRQLYQGTKSVYSLDEESINRRFRVSSGKGRASFYLGSFMGRARGSGFIHTNKDTLSVGVVASLDSLIRYSTEDFDRVGRLEDLQDEFESHPMVAELLEGARLVERSAHNLPRGSTSLLKQPYADGFLAAGDTLGTIVKLGPMVDGMRGAIASGMMAAKTFLLASSSGSYRARNLSRYRDLLDPVYDDVGRSGRESFTSESSFVYRTLPRAVLSTSLLSSTHRFEPSARDGPRAETRQEPRQEAGTEYELPDAASAIKVDLKLASKSLTKPWIPACPAACFSVVTSKGTFSSFNDAYLRNLSDLSEGGRERKPSKAIALAETREQIASGTLRFDPGSCVGCGTCGAIGPREMIEFAHDDGGRGVRYRFG